MKYGISLRHKLHHGALKSTLTDFGWVKVNREFSFSIGNLFKNLRKKPGFEFFWFDNQRHFQVAYLTFDTFSVLVLKCFQSWSIANFVRSLECMQGMQKINILTFMTLINKYMYKEDLTWNKLFWVLLSRTSISSEELPCTPKPRTTIRYWTRHLDKTFPLIIWIFTEGDGMESRLSS